MSDKTKIEWTDSSWPVVTGCDHVSPGCDNCYAARLTSGRLKHHPAYAGLAVAGRFTGEVRTHDDRLDWPLRWRKPRKIFVSDMADLFHDKVSASFVADVFAVAALTPQHTYQMLSKRHARMRSLLNSADFWYQVGRKARHLGYAYGQAANFLADGRNIYDTAVWEQLRYLPNVWLGVSVEDQHWADIRVPALLATPAAKRFLSCEPLLGPIDLTGLATHSRGPVAHWEGRDQINALTGVPRDPSWTSLPSIDWVIVGGESGRGDDIRPMHPDWARSLRDQCRATGTAYFFKQWGEWGPAPWSVRIPEPPGGWAAADPGWLAAAKAEAEARGATHCVRPDGSLYKPNHKTWSLERDPDGHYPGAVRRWGKKAAGRELDGRTWDEYPGGAV